MVGPQVRKLRLRKQWTQSDLAAKLQLAGWDTSRESVAKLENQRRRVPDLELFLVARVLGVKADNLIPPNVRVKIKETGEIEAVELTTEAIRVAKAFMDMDVSERKKILSQVRSVEVKRALGADPVSEAGGRLDNLAAPGTPTALRRDARKKAAKHAAPAKAPPIDETPPMTAINR